MVAVHASRSLCLWRPRCGSSVGSIFAVHTVQHTTIDAHVPQHIPVLLQETIAAISRNVLDPFEACHFVDGTAGCGGHASALLAHFPRAHLLCVDRDPEVLHMAQANLAPFHGRVSFQMGSYAHLDQHLNAAKFPSEVDGILVDLGANSYHFDTAQRGFSLVKDGPLDMRFNQHDASLRTAAEVVNTLSEVQLTKIFRDYGEERLAKEFAKAIVREREQRDKVWHTTRELRKCIERIATFWTGDETNGRQRKDKSNRARTHAVTRCFQALRIYVNDELRHVDEGVKQLVTHLKPRGRLVTIAFHSLEDRLLKDYFRQLDRQGRLDDLIDSNKAQDDSDIVHLDPVTQKRFRLVRRKATKASANERATNVRSRSARLRAIERIV